MGLFMVSRKFEGQIQFVSQAKYHLSGLAPHTKCGYYHPPRKQRGNLTGTSGSLYMLCALHALGVTSYQ